MNSRSHLIDRVLISSLAAFLALGVAAESQAATPESGPEEIIGGTTVDTCNWSATVGITGWGYCTGTLIHPRVVTTAAHCLEGATTATILFGESSGTGFSVEATSCSAGAQDANQYNTEKDWAYCVLPDDERVKKLPYIPPLAGCEVEKFFKVGAALKIVGFGTTSAAGQGAGIKRETDVKINYLGLQDNPSERVFNIGDSVQSGCHGDSGGPAFIHLVDNGRDFGWRTVGSTSGAGPEGDCVGSGYWVNIEMHIAAIEANEQIDVTPCTDDQGNWDPGPDCKSFPTAPDTAGGSWPGCNLGDQTTEAIDSCGVGTGGSAGGGMGGGGGMSGAGGMGGISGSGGAGSGGSAGGGGGAGTGGAGMGGSAGTASGGSSSGGSAGASSGGAGGAGNGGSSGGGASSGGASGVGGSAGTAATGGTGTDSTDDSGCSCSAVGAARSYGFAWVSLTALLLAWRRRPRAGNASRRSR